MTGSGGAVEASAVVQVTNRSASQRAGGTLVRTTTVASSTGSFEVSIPATIGDEIEIVVRDAAGNESPSVAATAGPALSTIQLRVVSGDRQIGVAGHALTDSFRVKATGGPNQTPVPGLAVVFGSPTAGGSFSRTTVLTDAEGNAASLYILGAVEGFYTLIAQLEVAPATDVEATARAVGAPQVTAVVPGTMMPGDTVTVRGANFSPDVGHNVVRFGAERATVVDADQPQEFLAPATALDVVVPPFATAGQVNVTLTGVTSNTVNVTVNPAAVEGRAIGEVRLETLPPSGEGQVVLPFEDATQEFALVIESLQASAILNGVEISGVAGASLRGGLTAAASGGRPVAGESFIRAMERGLLGGLSPAEGAAPRALAPAQDLGSTRQLWVVNKPTAISLSNPEDFDRVTATLRYVGDHTLIYVDNRAAGSLSDVEINEVGDRFDDRTYATDVGAFGEPSDIDANGKVIIVLSPTVNALTTPDIMAQNARIIGFFFGIDLVVNPATNPHANNGEVFYAVVPNENNEFTGARVSRAEIVDLLGSVFAHEFEHMISFNQHVFKLNGSLESLWLDEGLAHMAETLNGFTLQNRLRSALFLDSPSEVTLVAGGDGLDERGAAWLFVQYLVDRFGEGILGRLVQTRLTSMNNVASATETPFATVFHEWATMLLLDGTMIGPNGPLFELDVLDVRTEFEAARPFLGTRLGSTYLDVRSLFVPGATLQFQQIGTSPLYVTVTSRGRANVPITIDGHPNALLQVSVIRIR